MIEFSCPTCGRKHAASDVNGGRQGFCECGAVMTVPQANDSIQDGAPRVVAHDPNARDRLSWFIAIGGSIVGAVIVAIVVYALFFHDRWESDNTQRLLAIKADADTFVSGREDEKAQAKYQELFNLVAGQVIKSEFLKGEIEAARDAQSAVDKRLVPVLAARAEAEQKKQSLAHADYDRKVEDSRTPFLRRLDSSGYETRVKVWSEQFNRPESWIRQHVSPIDSAESANQSLVRARLTEDLGR